MNPHLLQDSSLQLIGRHIGDSAHKALISPDWDFNQMGIGGLGNEFSDIFRRAFASRVFPPDVVEELGMKHVRGILLYGPPGPLPLPLLPPSLSYSDFSRYWENADGKADWENVACKGAQDYQRPR